MIFEGLNGTAMDDAAILFNGEDGVPARGENCPGNEEPTLANTE